MVHGSRQYWVCWRIPGGVGGVVAIGACVGQPGDAECTTGELVTIRQEVGPTPATLRKECPCEEWREAPAESHPCGDAGTHVAQVTQVTLVAPAARVTQAGDGVLDAASPGLPGGGWVVAMRALTLANDRSPMADGRWPIADGR
jgi:hypothetical protein